MKRFLLLLLLATGLLRPSLQGQDSNTASAIADKQAAEENFKRLSADLESMLAANLALQRKVSALENELLKVREEQSLLRNASQNNNTAESLKTLAEKIQEVDRKRQADKELILAEFQKLGRTLAATPAPRNPTRVPAFTDSPAVPDKGYPYKIQPNDTLSAIVSDLNAQFKSKGMKTITQKQVIDANPNVNWNKLKIGQQIFIPAPSEK